ncbi:ubiquinol--cytochrome-c reductase subunit 8 [Chytridiales sp. JEL 0842]|nr:ubiquinol--cytochrome-c reductase subunit 8 [Chytridiales sp. JEL 0842]
MILTLTPISLSFPLLSSISGPLHKQVGFYEYGLSPFQVKPFAGFFNPGAGKFLSRTARQALVIVPPMLFFYGVAVWADKKFEYYHRKAYKAEHGHH